MPTKSPCSRAHPRAGTRRRNGNPSGIRVSALVGLGVLAVLSLQSEHAHAQNTDRVNVSYVAQPSLDACPDRGEIEGLDPQGDGFLAVRTGPNAEYEQIDELHNGDVVMLCDYRNGWHRVAYAGESQAAAECSTSSEQMADSKPYAGQCKSGWVHGNWVRWIW